MTRVNYGKLVLIMMIVAMAIAGCGNQGVVKDSERLQGTWKGTELGGRCGEWKIVITDDKVQADGPGPEDYSGTIILDETTSPTSAQLTINKCAFKQYVGATANNIYKFEDDKLILAGSEPGSNTKPVAFESGNGIRVFEFEKVEVE